MTLPFSFPDWMPPWLQLVVVVAVLLLGLGFALMPFSVFGVKGRLEALDARLEDIQTELRALGLRVPEPGRSYDEAAVLRAASLPREVVPVVAEPVRETRSPTLRAAARVGEAARERAEPRLRRE